MCKHVKDMDAMHFWRAEEARLATFTPCVVMHAHWCNIRTYIENLLASCSDH